MSVFYKDLSIAAVDLNAASDELGKCITALDAALKTLNLGISTWVRVKEHEDQNDNFWVLKLGYSRIAGTWGIAVRIVSGNERWPEESQAEEWLFNNAPRAYRIEAIDKIPELLQELIKEATSISQKIREKTAQARQLASAINRAASEVTPKRK